MYELEKFETQNAAIDGRGIKEVVMYLVNNCNNDSRRYNLPTSDNEIAAVFQTNEGEPPDPKNRYVVVYSHPNQNHNYSKINVLSKHKDPLLYPLIFPYGKEGIPHVGKNKTATRNNVTLCQYYCYIWL